MKEINGNGILLEIYLTQNDPKLYREGDHEMLKKILLALIVSILLFTTQSLANEILTEVDSLHDEKTINNYKTSIDLCRIALKKNQNDFDANWKCARSYRWYGELAKRKNMKDWEDLCAQYGKEGMQYAQKAIALEPNKPDGYYWYGLNVGIYSDGVSILTAISEGLKDKTQTTFEKVYELDKEYEAAGSIISLGRFWSVLPWPMNDKELSLKYFREFQKTKYFGKYPEHKIYMSELLLSLDGDEYKKEASQLLATLDPDETYFKNWKARLVADLN